VNGRQEPEKRFVNPYNFVELEGKCKRQPAERYREGERLTGFIECSLTSRTPLIIPNTSNDKALHTSKTEVEQSYDFYSYTNLKHDGSGAPQEGFHEPVIPGSELRGVIRSVHEAAFNGCLSTVDIGRSLHRRTMKPKKAGILRRQGGEWVIEPCKRYPLPVTPTGGTTHGKYVISRETYNQCEEGAKVSVKINTVKNVSRVIALKLGHVEDYGFQKGYLHKGEAFESKKYESVFVIPYVKPAPIPVDADEIKRLAKALEQYANPKLNRHINEGNHTGYAAYQKVFDELLTTNGQAQLLVYYSTYKQDAKEQATYLTPAMISKEVYRKTIGDLLKANGQYQPCTHRENVCPACSLFGMAGDKAGSSLGSRIRFSDAWHIHEDSHHSSGVSYKNLYEQVSLPELGEPKPGAVEFYTIPPKYSKKGELSEYHKWTYDDLLVFSKIQPLKEDEPRLRGRKFYWHHEPVKPPEAKTNSKKSDENLSMRKEVRAVKANIGFRFRVYFDQVTEKELAQLYWALTIGDGGDGKYAHKIGHGKPLGYGSAQITPASASIRRIDPISGERALVPYHFRTLDNNMLTSSKVLRQLQHISKFNSLISGIVSYPKVNPGTGSKGANDSASHQWFKSNMSKGSQFFKVLPTVAQEMKDKCAFHLFERSDSRTDSNSSRKR